MLPKYKNKFHIESAVHSAVKIPDQRLQKGKNERFKIFEMIIFEGLRKKETAGTGFSAIKSSKQPGPGAGRMVNGIIIQGIRA